MGVGAVVGGGWGGWGGYPYPRDPAGQQERGKTLYPTTHVPVAANSSVSLSHPGTLEGSSPCHNSFTTSSLQPLS